MTMPFHLRCLGEPALIRADGQPMRVKVRKHMALLVFLAVESENRHTREMLAELLWPGMPEGEGRHSLATALTALRAAFGREVVESSPTGVRWICSGVTLDLERLARGDVLGDDVTPPLDVGSFLDRFEVPGAAEFMLWRERQRARWLPSIRDALVVLMDRCRRTGDSRQMEQLADRMLALDELSEEAIRAKMESRAFAGDRLTALKIFEAWKERLDEELGAVPSQLLETMAIRLRKRGWERTAHSAIAAVRTDQWKDRPFIGRGREHRALYECWERIQQGEQGHAHVLGESGIGKTTLVERVTTAAGLEGATVSRVQCYDMEREIPYAAIGGLVRSLLSRPGATATSPAALSDLSLAVPDVRKRFPNIPPIVETVGETARLRIAEGLHELVTAVADEHPLILVVDDHHLADDASIALLHMLLRRVEGQKVMLVFIARPSELGQSPHAVRLRDNLEKFGTVAVELAPMPPEDCEEMVTALCPAGQEQPNAATRRALIRSARGYPMVLELLCQDWKDRGERSLALALDAMTTQPADTAVPTEAFRQLHDRIVQSLDPNTRNVLNLAAILGHRVDDIGMYSLADLTLGQTMAGMAQLTELRVLRDGGDGLEFVNEMIRAHAYVGVPATLRRLLHAGIAARLINSEREGEEILGLEVAWHCIRGGRVGEGVPYLLRGARQATQRGAPHEVDRALTSARPLLSGDNLIKGTLMLAEAKQEMGDWRESLRVLEQGPQSEDPAFHLWQFTINALAQHRLVNDSYFDKERIHLLDHAVSHASDVRTRTRALLVLAQRAHRGRDEQEASRLLQTAASLSVEEDLVASIEVRYCRAMLYALTAQFEQSAACIQDAEGMTTPGLVENSAAVFVRNGVGAHLASMGKYGEAIAHFERAHATAKRLDNIALQLMAAANAALCYHRVGVWSSVVEWGSLALRHADGKYDDYPAIKAAYHTAIGLQAQGRPEDALRLVEKASQGIPASAPAWLQQAWQLHAADVYFLGGRVRRAVAEAKKAVVQRQYQLLSASCAGAFARWGSKIAKEVEQESIGDAIQALVKKLSKYDRLDQVEILCAIEKFEQLAVASRGHRQPRSIARMAEIESRLGELPTAVGHQLRRLEML